MSYGGCGCAGGAVVTQTDEGTVVDIDPGPAVNNVAKKRQQKIYSDSLGRTVKTEILNWDGAGNFGTEGSVYATTVNTYNERDQVTQMRQYQGSETSGISQSTTTTFDGYGRLQSKHVPEQNAGTATVLTYNADDTVATRTDARDAVTTYGYNGRRLLTSRNYSVPSSVAATPNVAFDYDAGGNRIWMTDGAGRVDYNYDTLSRMQWEDRTFTGGGTYRISYDYNISGQVASVTDPFGSRIDYQRDQMGRVTDATGTGYSDDTGSAVSQFASGINYRASGALKEFSNGDIAARASFKLDYNARLQLTRFEAGGKVTENTYSPDGLIRNVHDLSYANFTNRFYAFDHAGRLQEANAFPATTTINPYGYTFAYDSWGNATSRLGNHYYDFVGYTTSYANNRDQHLIYDADGHPVNDNPNVANTKVYDAEEKQAINREQIPSPQIISYERTVYTYDGDGRQVKAFSYPESSNGAINGIFFYVRSTVLGGQVIAELQSLHWYFPPTWDEIRHCSYVYLNGEMLAKQTYFTNNTRWMVAWVYRNPVTGTNLEQSRAYGYPYIEQVIDPVGSEVGVEAPPAPAPPEGPPMSSTPLGDINNFGLGCVVDGVETDCNQALGFLNAGAATVNPMYWPGGQGGLPPGGLVPILALVNVGTNREPVWRLTMEYHSVHLFMSGHKEEDESKEETPQQQPCDVQIPDDDRSKVFVGVALTETTMTKNNNGSFSFDQYAKDKSDSSTTHFKGADAEQELGNELFYMASAMINRFADGKFKTWDDLAKAESIGYANDGQSRNSQLTWPEYCLKAKLMLNALAYIDQHGAAKNEAGEPIKFWRGVSQSGGKRNFRKGDVRAANTDFMHLPPQVAGKNNPEYFKLPFWNKGKWSW
jgi:YD repeat-containing protein